MYTQTYTKERQMQRRFAKPFSFPYPLKDRVVRDLKLQTIVAGVLTVSGTAYCNPSVSPFDVEESRYTVDIDYCLYNAVDVKPIYEITDKWADLEEAAVRHAAEIFDGTPTEETEETVVKMIERL